MPAPPPAPINVTATASEVGVITISWERTSPGSFSIFKGLSPGGEVRLITGWTVLSYDDTAIAGGETYYYYVTTVLNGVQSFPSNEASATAL